MLLYNLKTKLKKEPQRFLLILLNWSLSFLICIQPVSKPIYSINQHWLFLSLPVLQSQHGTRSYPCTHSDLHIITDNVDIEYRLVRSFAASIKIWGLSKEKQNILLFTVSREIHESMTWESWVHVMFVAIRFFGCFFFLWKVISGLSSVFPFSIPEVLLLSIWIWDSWYRREKGLKRWLFPLSSNKHAKYRERVPSDTNRQIPCFEA